jgi:arylsulfatase A-like enzyme
MLVPGTAPGVYSHVVAQRDIAATVLGGFGLVSKYPEIERFGRSWLRLRGAAVAEGPRSVREEPLHSFVVSYETTLPFDRWGDAPMASIVDDHEKLAVSYVDGLVRLYDLDADPREDHELATERPSDVARYRDELETFRDIDAPPP